MPPAAHTDAHPKVLRTLRLYCRWEQQGAARTETTTQPREQPLEEKSSGIPSQAERRDEGVADAPKARGRPGPLGPKHPAVPTSCMASVSPVSPVPSLGGSAGSFHCFGEVLGGRRRVVTAGEHPSPWPRALPEAVPRHTRQVGHTARRSSPGCWPQNPCGMFPVPHLWVYALGSRRAPRGAPKHLAMGGVALGRAEPPRLPAGPARCRPYTRGQRDPLPGSH